MERSEMRGSLSYLHRTPDFVALNPGYRYLLPCVAAAIMRVRGG
jgi:hypothetical protein